MTDSALRDPIAAKYVREFLGAKELLHGDIRWCLWLRDAPADELHRSAFISQRLAAVRQHRLDSKRPATREWADRPHLFDFDNQPNRAYVCAPSVSSEARTYLPVRWLPAETIASNAAFTAEDPDGFLFGLISSAMLLAWQKAVGGRLKSDMRFSNTIVWNNFPLPPVSLQQRADVVEGGGAVLEARASFPGRSLADLYTPSSMPAGLCAAHDQLDRAVDGIFCLSARQRTDQGRQSALFEAYARLDSGLLEPTPRTTRRRNK